MGCWSVITQTRYRRSRSIMILVERTSVTYGYSTVVRVFNYWAFSLMLLAAISAHWQSLMRDGAGAEFLPKSDADWLRSMQRPGRHFGELLIASFEWQANTNTARSLNTFSFDCSRNFRRLRAHGHSRPSKLSPLIFFNEIIKNIIKAYIFSGHTYIRRWCCLKCVSMQQFLFWCLNNWCFRTTSH